MLTHYTMRHNAVRAARKALGRDAVEGVDFHTFTSGPDDCISWHWVKGPYPVPESAPEADRPGTPENPSTALSGQESGPSVENRAEPARRIKRDVVLALIQRAGGASRQEIQDATGWQGHTVRGFLAGKDFAKTGHRAVRKERAPGVWAYYAEAVR